MKRIMVDSARRRKGTSSAIKQEDVSLQVQLSRLYTNIATI
jgi:hypothetical protein